MSRDNIKSYHDMTLEELREDAKMMALMYRMFEGAEDEDQ